MRLGEQRGQGRAGQKPGGTCHACAPPLPSLEPSVGFGAPHGVPPNPGHPRRQVAGRHTPLPGAEPGPPRWVIQLLAGKLEFYRLKLEFLLPRGGVSTIKYLWIKMLL